MVIPTSWCSMSLLFQMVSMACRAFAYTQVSSGYHGDQATPPPPTLTSYTGFPVTLLRAAISRSMVPAHAVQVEDSSVTLAIGIVRPWSRLICCVCVCVCVCVCGVVCGVCVMQEQGCVCALMHKGTQVMGSVPLLLFLLTLGYGRPVELLKDGSSLLPRSSAMATSWSSYHPSCGCPLLFRSKAVKCAPSNPLGEGEGS